MLPFILKRLLFILLVTISIVFAVHWGMLLASRTEALLPSIWPTAQGALSETRDFFANALRGDLGTYFMIAGERPVKELLWISFSASMGLLLLTALLSAVIGLLLGIFAALTRIRGLAFSILVFTLVGISVPSFFAAMLLQHGIIVYFREFDRRLLSVAGFGWDYQHLLLPMLVLAARPVAYLMRTSYIVLDRTMQEDYVRTAHSKGLSRRYIVNVHALRNVAVPILTAVAVSWRFSLGILPVVEYIFAWPGMGLRILEGILSWQVNMVAPLAAVFGLTLLLGNLILEIAYRLVDPRVRENA